MLYLDKSLRGGCSGRRMSTCQISLANTPSQHHHLYLPHLHVSIVCGPCNHAYCTCNRISVNTFFITTENEREKYFIPMWLCTNILYNFTIIWLLSKKSATIQTSSRHKERDKKRYISYSICDFFCETIVFVI